MPKNTSRQQILDTAHELFYREGFRATGVDTLAASSGVGKMTLYRHFATKDDLIVATLERSNQQFWEWFEQATAPAVSPREKILAFFRAMEDLASSPACHGCPFLSAAVDFPDLTHPGHRVAVNHKNAVRARFGDLAGQAGHPQPDLLANQLLLLMDGAFISIRLYGVENPARHISKAAQALLDSTIPNHQNSSQTPG